MASVRLLRRAEADLEAAVAWYEDRSQRASRRFDAAVTAALDRLAAMPEMYTLVDERHLPGAEVAIPDCLPLRAEHRRSGGYCAGTCQARTKSMAVRGLTKALFEI